MSPEDRMYWHVYWLFRANEHLHQAELANLRQAGLAIEVQHLAWAESLLEAAKWLEYKEEA